MVAGVVLLNKIPLSERSISSRTVITQLVEEIRNTCKQQKQKYMCIHFDELSDEDYFNLTGLKKTQFEDFCPHEHDKVKCTPSRTPRMYIGLFLLKMKSALSNRLLAMSVLDTTGIRAAMSTFIEKGEKQMSVQDANMSKMVTKVILLFNAFE